MDPQKMNRISGALLLLGLGGALVIFMTAAPEVQDPLVGDQFSNKKYMREMRVMGGQGNVLMAEFNEWFAGLWHGRALGGTMAVVTIGTVLVFRFVASHPGMPAAARSEDETPPPGST